MPKYRASAILCISTVLSAMCVPVSLLADDSLAAVGSLSQPLANAPAITIKELNAPGSANWNGFFLVRESELTNQPQTPDAFLIGTNTNETQDRSTFTILSVPVPEPTGVVLMIVGGLGMLRKRK